MPSARPPVDPGDLRRRSPIDAGVGHGRGRPVCIACLHGLACEDLRAEALEQVDDRHPLRVTARAVKPLA